MKKIWLFIFLWTFISPQNMAATPVDFINPKTPTEESVKPKKKKKKFFARMTERIMKKRVGKMMKKLRLDFSDCARIIKSNGEKLDVVIVKIGRERIRYKKCDFQNGPTHTILKEDISMIKYADGTEEVIEDDEKIKQARKIARQNNNLKLYYKIGFLIGILITIGIFFLVVFAFVLKGEERKQLFRGVLSGLLTLLLLVVTLGFLLSV